MQSITHTANNHVRVWIKTKPSDEEIRNLIKTLGENYKNVASEMYYNELDCTEKKIRILSSAYYSKDGKVISTDNFPDAVAEWMFIIPESMGNALYEKVCK